LKCDREPTLAAVGFAVAADDDDDDDSSCLIGAYIDFPKIVQCDKNGEVMDWYGMVWYGMHVCEGCSSSKCVIVGSLRVLMFTFQR